MERQMKACLFINKRVFIEIHVCNSALCLENPHVDLELFASLIQSVSRI